MSRHIVPAAEELLDNQFPVLDHGFVILVDYMGSDGAIAQAARESKKTDARIHTPAEDRALIRRLMSDMHTSPFEMVEFKFHCAMPIFVARQWIRHRTANVNEQSGRYGEMPELVYVPEAERVAWQNPVNKQGSGAQVPQDIAEAFCSNVEDEQAIIFEAYRESLGRDWGTTPTFTAEQYRTVVENGGISRELARINLPLSTYTQWYWKIDLHNLLHFLFLRLDEHAQWEIRQYAKVMAEMVKAVCPMAWEAFVDYRLQAVRLSLPELEALHVLIAQFLGGRSSMLPDAQDEGKMRLSKREVGAFRTKLTKVLGLDFLDGF